MDDMDKKLDGTSAAAAAAAAAATCSSFDEFISLPSSPRARLRAPLKTVI